MSSRVRWAAHRFGGVPRGVAGGVAGAGALGLMLSGCSGVGEGTPADVGTGGEVGYDVASVLFTEAQLPERSEVDEFDVSQLAGVTAGLELTYDELSFEPAECADDASNPFAGRAATAEGMYATLGEGAEAADGAATPYLSEAVYAGVDSPDLASAAEYVERCGDVAVSGTVAGEPIKLTVRTSLVEPPDVGADDAIAFDTTRLVESGPGTGEPGTTRVIYLADGGDGVRLSGDPASRTFPLDELAATALERLRAARGDDAT